MVDPLQTMIIRRADLDALVTTPGVTSRLSTRASPVGGTFGMVRSSGQKRHTGWDLYAAVGTSCYALCASEFVSYGVIGDYGNTLVLKLLDATANALAKRHQASNLFAMYCHLSGMSGGPGSYMAGAAVALTGNSGNAATTPAHLHFEIRKTAAPRKGDNATIDPAELLGSQYYASRPDDVQRVKSMYGIR